ncbi:hypothetical protein SK128_000974 [Halocaridina rubra]|uniref:Uncharacterized protein n=1 Tax=Halocaridina rubra TaxID=373956 RepID=A0AAN8X2H1_HALRR
MIVINSNMLSGEAPRLNLVTSSRDYLATVDYPLRPNVSRTWGQLHRPKSRWTCCYFPQSFPVYRMQRLISVVLCLLVLILLSVIAFVFMQVVPTQVEKNAGVTPGGTTENRLVGYDDYRRWESGLGLVRTARKLEDHPEYKRSVEGEEDEEDYPDEEDEDDELILNSYGDNGYDDDEEDNPIFDMKYFDFSMKGEVEERLGLGNTNVNLVNVPQSSFTTPNVKKKWESLPELILVNSTKMNIVENGIIFSQAVEALLVDKNLSDIKIGQILDHLRSSEVKAMQNPTWDRCGRPKNQWLKFSSGSAACARYRYPDDYLLVGEILSFYLSRLLGVGHVPPVVLSQPTGPQWQQVKMEMKNAGWGDAPVVVLTPWFEGLVRDHMPAILLEALMKNATLSIVTEDGNFILKDSDNPPHHHFSQQDDDVQKEKEKSETVERNYLNIKHSLKRNLKEIRVSRTLDKNYDIYAFNKTSSKVAVTNRVPPVSAVLHELEIVPENKPALLSVTKNKKNLREKVKNKDYLNHNNSIKKMRNSNTSKNLKNMDTVNSEFQENPQRVISGISASLKLRDLPERDLKLLVQWSDLVVFDYLTGNYDRVAYMQDAAEKEDHLQILSRTVHNLVRNKATDALWLLDNESGLIDAYTLLYGSTDSLQSERFLAFHKQMLETICLFRKSTIEAVLGLHTHPEPHMFLVNFVKTQEPLFHILQDPLENSHFVKYFPVRVKEVHDWMNKCIDKVQRYTKAR